MSKNEVDSLRDRALDGLRGIAILLVLVMHSMHFQPAAPFWAWLNAAAKVGWVGVDLFFVLSGFLITRVLCELREAPNRLHVFYGRRALRILPAYFFYLLLAVPTLLFFAKPEHAQLTREMLPWLLVFLQNFHSAWTDSEINLGPLSHLWSLSVEEQFYLFWPLVIWHVRTQNLARVAIIFWILAVLCKLLFATMQVLPHIPYVLTITRMDGFAAGAWLASWLVTGKKPLPRWLHLMPLLAGTILIAAFVVNRGGFPSTVWIMVLCLTMTPVVFAGLLHATLVASTNSTLRKLLGQPVLIFFGRHSYALYLVHAGIGVLLIQTLMPLLKEWMPNNAARLIVILLIWLGSIALSLLIDRFIDSPARRYKDRLQANATSSCPQDRIAQP